MPVAPSSGPSPLEITIRTSAGTGRTLLSAFDDALHASGVSNFNLIPLSSVIPPGSTLTHDQDRLVGRHGDKLYCVMAVAHAEHPGETAWAGLGWVVDPLGAGLFVEHHAGSEESLLELIHLSLGDMTAVRGGGYGPVQTAVARAHYVDRPACALALAAYQVRSWGPEDDRG